MPINTEHPEFKQFGGKWKRCRDAIAGQDAIKAGGELYLPKLSGHSPAEYGSYKARAMYFNASGRTLDVYRGLLFKEPPVITMPKDMESWSTDITMAGETLGEFIARSVEEVLTVGRAGVLIDRDRATDGPKSRAEYEKQGLRPYPALYSTESIINWKEGRVGGRQQLILLVLKEPGEAAEDEYGHELKERYRELRLTPSGVIGRLWEEVEKANANNGTTKTWEVIDEYKLTESNGNPMTSIPFVILDPVSGSFSVDDPPLLDLVNMNISHYQTMADLENARHWTASPTPVFIGDFVQENGSQVTEVKMGSSSGIHLTQGSDAKFLEYAGTGITALENADTSKREIMAILGARLLSDQKSGVEAAETVKIYRAGESATLAEIANAVSKQLTKALTIMRDWENFTGDVKVQINTDYTGIGFTAQEWQTFLNYNIAGRIPDKDLFFLLRKSGLIAPETTLEEFLAGLKDAGQAGLGI